MKRKNWAQEGRLLLVRVLPLLLGISMAGTMLAQPPSGFPLAAVALAVLAGLLMALGASIWLLLCYRAPEQTQPWQRGVLLCYAASGLCCLAVAGVRDIFGRAALGSYGSEMVFGGIILLLTGVGWLRMRTKWKRESDRREPWER